MNEDAFAAICAEIRACRVCAARFKATATAHTPRPVLRGEKTARICVIGQAPGIWVHRSGLPFNDASGQRLRRWMGVSADEFYDAARIATLPMAFCFPGYNAKGADLPPPPICAKLWRDRLDAAAPDFALTLLVGAHAQKWALGARRKASMSETVANWREYTPHGVIPLPHPSWRNNHWLKANPWFEQETVPWLQRRLRALLSG